jgi:HAD superfamily hydrolase (TIGR01509 family)
MLNNVKGVIFDCDGVLFESRRANLAYYNAILSYFGEPGVTEAQPEKANLCHAAASPEVFAVLLGADKVSAALAYAATLNYRQFIPWMDPEPGMRDVLRELSETRPLAVATNRGSSMSEILQHFDLEDYFSTVVTSRDVPRPKPHADMLLLAASRLGLPLGELLFVGDSPYDRMAAEAAGIRFVAYRSSFAHPLRVESHAELAVMISEGVTGGT